MLAILSGCTKEGDFWNLNRRNPADERLNINPEDNRLPYVRTLPPTESEPQKWRAELVHPGSRKMVAVGWVWSEDGSWPEYPQLPATISGTTETGTHAFLAPDNFCNDEVKYRAFAVNRFGVHHGEVLTFTTAVGPSQMDWGEPAAGTITSTSIFVSCSLSLGECANPDETGVCWSLTPEPSINDNHLSLESESGSFSTNLTGFGTDQTVHIRFYASSQNAVDYSEELVVTTLPPSAPSVSTTGANNISLDGATLGGDIQSDGGSPITNRGFYLSTLPVPSESDLVINAPAGNDTFEAMVSNLNNNTTYYFRAFATNNYGTSTGSTLNFTTQAPISLPAVTTQPASAISTDEATLHGMIVSNGGGDISQRGFYLSTSPSPSAADLTLYATTSNISFSSPATGLSASTTYYYEAFATNEAGTSTGTVQSFTTSSLPTPPQVATYGPQDVSTTTSLLSGEVLSSGGSNVYARGFYVSTDGSPDAGDVTYTSNSGIGSFAEWIDNLTPSTSYQYRAFASNNVGTGLGSIQTFTTHDLPVPIPVNPIEGEMVECCYLYLDWSCVEGADEYEVQISTNANFTGNVVSMPEIPGGWLTVGTVMTGVYPDQCFDGITSSQMLGTGTNDASGETFFWRVRVNNGGNPGPWSPPASFLYIY